MYFTLIYKRKFILNRNLLVNINSLIIFNNNILMFLNSKYYSFDKFLGYILNNKLQYAILKKKNSEK